MPQITVHSDQQSAGVGTGNDAALSVCFHIDNIVQIRLFRIGNIQTEVLHQTKTEAIGRLGVIVDGHLAAAGHHHAQVLLQFLRGKVHGGVQGDFVNAIHVSFLLS